eukprot:Rhum_TRINITY_DN14374_c0_g1::Rhum_TRINITY_DN14374_c0_g1_i1::g.83335::m.83335
MQSSSDAALAQYRGEIQAAFTPSSHCVPASLSESVDELTRRSAALKLATHRLDARLRTVAEAQACVAHKLQAQVSNAVARMAAAAPPPSARCRRVGAASGATGDAASARRHAPLQQLLQLVAEAEKLASERVPPLPSREPPQSAAAVESRPKAKRRRRNRSVASSQAR